MMRARDESPWDIQRRTRQYALRGIRLARRVEREGTVGKVIGRQFLRSAVSIGANIAEAQAAESRRDFIHKYSIAHKESNESLYWLMLLAEAEIIPAHRLQPLIDETRELVAIITSILIRARQRASHSRNSTSS